MSRLQVTISLLKARAALRRARLVASVIVAAMLPAVALGASVAGYHMLAEVPLPLPYKRVVDDLATRDMAYWFLALAGIAIMSWTWIVKWLIKQLDSQRAANADVTTRLITYMEKDHADMRAIMGRTHEVLDRVLDRISAPRP